MGETANTLSSWLRHATSPQGEVFNTPVIKKESSGHAFVLMGVPAPFRQGGWISALPFQKKACGAWQKIISSQTKILHFLQKRIYFIYGIKKGEV
ncbi:MAG: hypothetical protein IJF04_05765, partial [Oscillospiraceae bacterium]|nr:hypothetical protein [Oscillospiraceae bacterium]